MAQINGEKILADIKRLRNEIYATNQSNAVVTSHRASLERQLEDKYTQLVLETGKAYVIVIDSLKQAFYNEVFADRDVKILGYQVSISLYGEISFSTKMRGKATERILLRPGAKMIVEYSWSAQPKQENFFRNEVHIFATEQDAQACGMEMRTG